MTTPWKRALLAIATELGQANIRFALGGSGLLYFKGVAIDPHDIDLIVHEDDIDALHILLSHYNVSTKDADDTYLTKHFFQLDVLGISVDIMVNFAIKQKDTTYEMPFIISELIPHQGVFLPLGSLEDWITAYHYMNRIETLTKIEQFQSFQIRTNRLTIRYLDYDNHPDMLPYVSDETNMFYERGTYDSFSLFQLLSDVIPERLMYGIYKTDDQSFIGHLYLGPYGPKEFQEYMIGYILHPDYHNNGYCTEATKALIDYAFQTLQAHRVTAKCNPDNIASWKVMEKAGLLKEGLLKQRVCFKRHTDGSPIWWDELIYGITIDDWKESLK